MKAMAEGEELGFLLVPMVEKGTYRVTESPKGYLMEFNEVTTARLRQKDGWEVLCFYDANKQLLSAMQKTSQDDAQKLNVAQLLQQVMGQYSMNGQEVTINWEVLTVGEVTKPFKVETFNGLALNVITVKDSGTTLDGTWEVEFTKPGLKLHQINYSEGAFMWDRTGKSLNLIESNPSVGRFFFTSITLLNGPLGRYDKSLLRLMRNAIMARHGYTFQSADLKQYFGGEPWYHPATSNSEVKLSFVEELNVELIKHQEAQ